MEPTHIETISRGVLIRDDRLLVCRNRLLGHTFLPGGHVEFGESAAAALVREISEELGVHARAGAFLGACEARFEQQRRSNKGSRLHHEINLLFSLLIDQPELDQLASREEKIEFAFLPLADLKAKPELLLPTGITRLVLEHHSGSSPGWLSLID